MFSWSLKKNCIFCCCDFQVYFAISSSPNVKLHQNHMTFKGVTSNSFPWNKARDFRNTNFMPKYADKKEIEAARTGKCTSFVTSK